MTFLGVPARPTQVILGGWLVMAMGSRPQGFQSKCKLEDVELLCRGEGRSVQPLLAAHFPDIHTLGA